MKNKKPFKYWLQVIIILFMITGCQKVKTANVDEFEEAAKSKALEFFETFSERSDWDKFCSFYRDDVHFKDITLQLELDSLWKFKRFYKWDEEGDRFKKLSQEQEHLNLQSLIVNENIVAAKGQINPFYYDNVLVDTDWGMEFTIWLRFDENLKIIEQIDWMEYDPNTLETVIIQYREKGFEKVPEWLGISNDY